MFEAKDHAVIQNKAYRLKPYSKVNMTRLNNIGSDMSEKLSAGDIDKFEYWDALLRVVLVGPYEWEMDDPDFDGRDAEAALLSFLPPSMQASVLLFGWERS